ncbi:MAG: calcium/sodium antiporter [Alphaproteobacteria bacterium]|nr:calcium/sodium antiporter [Alphaproteobacteria bacterium]
MDFVYIIGGLVLLFLGGEGLVRGSVALAYRMGISTLLVSLVVVGFGTSAPELIVSINAALSGSPEIALGNVVGSNIANVLLILGTAGLITPLLCDSAAVRRDSLAVIVVSAGLACLSFLDVIDWRAGAMMLLVLFGYLYFAYSSEKNERRTEQKKAQKDLREHISEDMTPPKDSALLSIVFLIGGLLFLVVGAHYLVEGAASIARSFGISEAVIGLSLIAFGTSLPELATAIVASIRGHSDVIIGNVLGSNLFNILSILGVTALIAPLPLSGRIVEIDVWIMLASAAVLFPVILTGHKISRLEGAGFVALYLAYIGFMFVI